MVNIDKGACLCVIVLHLVEGKLLFCDSSKHWDLDGEAEVFLLTLLRKLFAVWLEVKIQP